MRLALLLTLGLAACGSDPHPPSQFADPDDPAYAQSFDQGQDDTRISTSRGPSGGVIVLWPRIVPESGERDDIATAIQESLQALAQRAAGQRDVEVRPRPERACPSNGCEAAAVGAVLLHQAGTCAVVAWTSLPGETPAHLTVWAGDVELRNSNVDFRQPPEDQISVLDFESCDDISARMRENETPIENAIRAVVRD